MRTTRHLQQPEVYFHHGLSGYGLSIHGRWTEFPLAHGFGRAFVEAEP
jgi:hypothetical protein